MSQTEPNSVRIADLAAAIEAWAPAASAQSYDNVGLQIGRPEREVGSVLVALDLTPAVVQEAREMQADLILTHHPLIFRPLKNLTPGNLVGALALQLAEANIALFAAHTNLDAATDGVSFALARALDLENVRFLQRLPDTLYKLVTFVPASHLTAVREALAAAGAGRIGDYDACAFASEGTGYFRAGASTNPFIGRAGGGVEEADEQRLEVEIARWDLDRVLHALREAHPYEEVAYDVYPVAQEATRHGMGAIGDLATAVSLREFLEHAAAALQTDALRFAGNSDARVQRVAVCGGSGSDLIGAARRQGADALVTADVTYHRFFETMDASGSVQMAIIDAGHYETEAMTEQLLCDRLSDRFPSVTFHRTSTRTSPVRWHIRKSMM